MDTGDCAFAFAAFASYAIDELRDDVEELTFGGQLVDLTFDFGRFIVLYWQVCPLDFV